MFDQLGQKDFKGGGGGGGQGILLGGWWQAQNRHEYAFHFPADGQKKIFTYAELRRD